MEYNEAKEKKRTIGTTYFDSVLTYQVFVTPELEKDFEKYKKEIITIWPVLKDEHSQHYSKNAKYKVRGLFLDKNTTPDSIHHKDL